MYVGNLECNAKYAFSSLKLFYTKKMKLFRKEKGNKLIRTLNKARGKSNTILLLERDISFSLSTEKGKLWISDRKKDTLVSFFKLFTLTFDKLQ